MTSRVVSASVQLANFPLLTLNREKPKPGCRCTSADDQCSCQLMSDIGSVDRGKPQMTSGDIYTGCSLTAAVIREEIKQHAVLRYSH